MTASERAAFINYWVGKHVFIKYANGNKIRGEALKAPFAGWLEIRAYGYTEAPEREVFVNPEHIMQINETEPPTEEENEQAN